MEILYQALGFLGGLALLAIGGEQLVRGAANIASRLGISPLVVGLTVVAFGTSAPELAVSVEAAFRGSADIAVGNVVGSNIANILFILGLSAIAAPLAVQRQIVKLDLSVMIFASGLSYLMARDLLISTLEGVCLFFLLLAYIGVLLLISKRQRAARNLSSYVEEGKTRLEWSSRFFFFDCGRVVFGLVMLVIGADLLIDAATLIARSLGVSELVIGLTIVAVGTSLPELATSVVASLKGERDIAVGNIVGSNIFNILCVLGLTAVAAPAGVPISGTAVDFDFLVMLAVSIACPLIFYVGYEITRLNGALFLSYYVAYVSYLALTATQSDSAQLLSMFMLLLVIPLTVVGIFLNIAISIYRSKSKRA